MDLKAESGLGERKLNFHRKYAPLQRTLQGQMHDA